MKRILILLSAAAALCACGTARQATGSSSQSDEEVNIGYGSLKREEVGFAVDKVKIKEDVVTSYTSIAEYLRGRVAGVEINPNGTVQIRVAASL